MKLSDKAVDELWFRCDFIYDGCKDDANKALRKIELDGIKKNFKTAKLIVKNFISETPIDNIKKNLEELEK